MLIGMPGLPGHGCTLRQQVVSVASLLANAFWLQGGCSRTADVVEQVRPVFSNLVPAGNPLRRLRTASGTPKKAFKFENLPGEKARPAGQHMSGNHLPSHRLPKTVFWCV